MAKSFDVAKSFAEELARAVSRVGEQSVAELQALITVSESVKSPGLDENTP